jgi:hypothetical protein
MLHVTAPRSSKTEAGSKVAKVQEAHAHTSLAAHPTRGVRAPAGARTCAHRAAASEAGRGAILRRSVGGQSKRVHDSPCRKRV